MNSIELQYATGEVIMALTGAMTPEQLRTAALELRALTGDAISLKFYAGVADSLDKYADETETDDADDNIGTKGLGPNDSADEMLAAFKPRYVTAIPDQVPAGQVLVHNQVAPAARLGTRGFRAWLANQATDGLVRCDCGWAPRLPEHYRVDLSRAAT
jgi:hypothetical protein